MKKGADAGAAEVAVQSLADELETEPSSLA